ncbi:hypothetical protein [Piscinibacterium candidicorallinum]|uniref:Uncharacterized protein n=1 Tax=Piscinibacterium candidicorallinum TaxID=1793872 RepID=A0ABV7H3H5_9BURK
MNPLAACALLCAATLAPSFAFAQAAAQPAANASTHASPQAAAMMAIDWAAVKPSTQLEVVPADKPGVYELRAVITDLATGKELMRPRLLTEAGKEARIEVGAEGATLLRMAVTVKADGSAATTSTEVRRKGVLEASQRTELRLR